MNRWLRVFAPAVALAVVLAAFAALGGGRASARPAAVAARPAVAQAAQLPPVAAQPAVALAARPAAVAAQPTVAQVAQPPAPTEEPKTGPDTDTVEQQDGPQSGAQDEAQDSAETPDDEAAEAAALASKATITADQAKAAELAANPGATAVKVELDDENGTIVYVTQIKKLPSRRGYGFNDPTFILVEGMVQRDGTVLNVLATRIHPLIIAAIPTVATDLVPASSR